MPKICREEVVAHLKRGECNSDVKSEVVSCKSLHTRRKFRAVKGTTEKIRPSTAALFLVERQGQEQTDRAIMEDNGTHGSKMVEGEIWLSVTKRVIYEPGETIASRNSLALLSLILGNRGSGARLKKS